MDTARAVMHRLERIEALEREGAGPKQLLAEVRELLREGEAWLETEQAGTELAGDGETTYEIRAGDCLVHLAGAEAHSVVAGPEGIDYLAFGTRATAEYALFPRLKAGRIGMLWADMIATHQWTQELALGDPELPEPSPRPQRIVNIDELEEADWGRGAVRRHTRDLGIAAASGLPSVNH